ARIKRIMRLDEEVGKVAQVTPFLVAKALELFLQSLVEKTLKITQDKGFKRMTAQHVKECVESVEEFDFLKDIVQKVPAMEEEEEPKKRKRKKKDEDSKDEVKQEVKQED
ncbi:histone-fold-containing protein, partial [Gorgonomyces haynaldii]